MSKVFKVEPIAVKGALSYGLKDITAAMYNSGCIASSYQDCDMDGITAAVTAIRMNKDPGSYVNRLSRHPDMKRIARYNELDVKVIYEIVNIYVNITR